MFRSQALPALAALPLLAGVAQAANTPVGLPKTTGQALVRYAVKPVVAAAAKASPGVKVQAGGKLPGNPNWAEQHVRRAFDYGIFNGQYKQGFKGESAMTRFHAAVMTTRLYEKLEQGQGFEQVARQGDLLAFDREVSAELQANLDDLKRLQTEVKELRATVYKLRTEKPPAPKPKSQPPPVVLPPSPRAERWNPMQRLGFAPEIFMPTDGDVEPGVGWALDYQLTPRNKRGFLLGVGQVHGLDVTPTGDLLDIDRYSLTYMFKSHAQRGLNYGLGLDWLDVTLATPGLNVGDTTLGYHLRATWPIGRRLLSEVRYQQASLDELVPGRVTPDPSGVSLRLWWLLAR